MAILNRFSMLKLRLGFKSEFWFGFGLRSEFWFASISYIPAFRSICVF